MYRVSKLSGRYFAVEMDSIEDEIENIETFVGERTVVIIVDDLSDLNDIGIDADEVEIVN